MNARGKMHLKFAQPRFLLLSVCLVLGTIGLADPTFSAEWSYETRVSERFEYDDNIFLDKNSPGEVFGSLTSVAADVAWAGPSQYWNLHSDADFKKYFGSDSDDRLDALNQHYKLTFHKEGPVRAFNLSSSLAVENAALSELRDTGFTREDGDRLTFGVDGDVSVKLNSTNKFTLAGSSGRVDFTDDSSSLVPFFNIAITGSWSHQLSERTAFSTELGWSIFRPDDIADEKTHTYKAVGRLNKKLRENLTLGIRGGANFRTDNNSGGGAFDLTDSSTSGVAGIDLQFASATKTLTLSASHDLVPSASGELQQRTSVSVGATGQINSRARIGISAEYQHQEASGTTGVERDFFSISPSYSVVLARRWSAALGYSFKLEDEAGDISTSNQTYFSVTRTFSKRTCSAACTD